MTTDTREKVFKSIDGESGKIEKSPGKVRKLCVSIFEETLIHYQT